jgi:hypothetical protein
MAASNGQMIPLQKECTWVNEHHVIKECYLFPQEVTKTKSTTSMTAQAKQTKKHYENQDNIGDKDEDHARLALLCVDCHAGQYIWHPNRVKLQCDRLRKSTNDYSLVTCMIPKTKLWLGGLRYMTAHSMNEGSPTLDEESNVGDPYAGCNHHNELVFIPNGDANGTQGHSTAK